MTDEEQLLLNNLKLNVQQFFGEFARIENEKKELEKNVLNLKHEIESVSYTHLTLPTSDLV